MTALDQIGSLALLYALCLGALALVLGQLRCLMQAARLGRGRRAAVVAAGNLLLGFLTFSILLDCSFLPYLFDYDLPRFRPFQWKLFALPWAVYALAECLCLTLLCLQLRANARFRRLHLTPDAIQQTLDLLPEGLAISAADGTVLLANLQMNALSYALTGTGLSDASRFWQRVEAEGKEQNGQYLVPLPSGEVWQLDRGSLRTEDGDHDRIRATNVTECYRIVQELAQKHEHLQDLQRRMRAVADLSGDMFVAQEAANARVALHNQLGQVLLMGRHLIEHPEATDPGVVYVATGQMNAFLLGEAETPPRKADDPLQSAMADARSIGVTTELPGKPPENAARLRLLANAIRECAANARKHAGGDRVSVRVSEDGRQFTLTNNGSPPKRPILPSGGLLALQKEAESLGGTMQLQSSPEFALTFTFS